MLNVRKLLLGPHSVVHTEVHSYTHQLTNVVWCFAERMVDVVRRPETILAQLNDYKIQEHGQLLAPYTLS